MESLANLATPAGQDKDLVGQRMRAAVIGLGRQAMEDHIPAIKACSDVDLVAVVDSDRDKLEIFSVANPTVKTYATVNDLLEKERIDFAVIAVPHFLHYEIFKILAEAGVHILEEKPFATSMVQAKEMCRIADEHKVRVMVTLQRRFNPIYVTFCQFIDKIGDPFFIEAKYTFYTPNPHEGWRGKKEFAGGGCLMDMGYHIVDLLMWYFGLPDLVFADLSYEAKEGVIYDAEDTAQVIFRYNKKKIFGSLLVSRAMSPKQEFIKVYGTRGVIYLERGKIERYSPSGDILESLKRENRWPSAAQDQIEYFLRVIRGERDNENNPAFHFNHLSFIEAAYKSKEQGTYVNPKKFL